MLVLRFGPKTSAVKVVKGQASWNLMPDVTQPLASSAVISPPGA